jgi:hypothetical protein
MRVLNGTQGERIMGENQIIGHFGDERLKKTVHYSLLVFCRRDVSV